MNSATRTKGQELTSKEFELIQELVKTRMEQASELEYETLDGYELPPRAQFSMLKKPAVSIKYGALTFSMASIRLFEGVKHILPIVHPGKRRLSVIMCHEEESASVEWARQKDERWVNKQITSLEFTENLFKLMNWDRALRYKIIGRAAASIRGLILVFDLDEAVMMSTKPEEYVDGVTGEIKKRQVKYYPDKYKDRIGMSYADYAAAHQMNMFEDILEYCDS